MDKEALGHGIAGTAGGMVAMAALYPLDQIKTIMQVEDANRKDDGDTKRSGFWTRAFAIVKQERWNVYQGHVSTQVALGWSNFVYFFCYNRLKSGVLRRTKQDTNALVKNTITPTQNLVLSCIAGIINVYLTAPLWVVNMRLKSKDHAKFRGMLDCALQIVSSEGVLALWNGTLASLMLVSNPVIHYFSYERMKTALQQLRARALGKEVSISATEIFVLGALAKSLTTVITYPLQVAQSVMRIKQASQKAQDPRSKKSNPEGLSECIQSIYSDKGIQGLFAGMEAKLLQTVLTAAITLVTYEKLLAFIMLFMNGKPKAISKSAA
ncbi:TPA: hypothetical protein N0F65_002388 [Lagenidium giganteum]|uniref:Mitochondrial carrier protein n=1 Tax=Lagenidium giganteum TaxID=4803 RepID=A0AAV2YPX9_9STRA|nr:TPA: hypothetical protein N0F65_002388 [Lagenidium giganteum]